VGLLKSFGWALNKMKNGYESAALLLLSYGPNAVRAVCRRQAVIWIKRLPATLNGAMPSRGQGMIDPERSEERRSQAAWPPRPDDSRVRRPVWALGVPGHRYLLPGAATGFDRLSMISGCFALGRRCSSPSAAATWEPEPRLAGGGSIRDRDPNRPAS